MNKVINVKNLNLNKVKEFSRGYVMAFDLFGYKTPKQTIKYLNTLKTASLEDSFKETGRLINQSMRELDSKYGYWKKL